MGSQFYNCACTLVLHYFECISLFVFFSFSSPEPSCRNRAKRALGESIPEGQETGSWSMWACVEILNSNGLNVHIMWNKRTICKVASNNYLKNFDVVHRYIIRFKFETLAAAVQRFRIYNVVYIMHIVSRGLAWRSPAVWIYEICARILSNKSQPSTSLQLLSFHLRTVQYKTKFHRVSFNTTAIRAPELYCCYFL